MAGLTYDFSMVRNLDVEGWNRLGSFGDEHTIPLRQAALQELENTIAESQGRKPCEVIVSSDYKSACGNFRKDENAIYVSKADVEGKVPPHEAVNTVAHEGRHSYQHHVKDNPAAHPELSEAEKGALSHNLEPGNYIRPEKDFEGYKNQPVEKDAEQFAGYVEGEVCGPRLESTRSTEQTVTDAKHSDKPDDSLARAKAEAHASLQADRPPLARQERAEATKPTEAQTAAASPTSQEDRQPSSPQKPEDKSLAEAKAAAKASLKEDRPPPPPPPPPPSQGRGMTM